MSSPSDAQRALQAQALRLLNEVYLRYALRYGARGLPLADFRGRWLALRHSTALDPAALPLIDEQPWTYDHEFALFRRDAVSRADSERLVFVRLRRARSMPIGGGARDERDRLSITVTPSAGEWGLVGGVELDTGGRAVAPSAPVPMSLMAP